MALPHVGLGATKHEYKTKDGKIYKNGIALTDRQIVKELQETINRSDAEIVVIGTPIDLAKLISVNKPTVRVRYDLSEEKGSLEEALSPFK